MLRASESISPKVCSVAEIVFAAGVLRTIDAGGGRGLDVDRVDADAGARDDGQLRSGGQQIAVDARLRTHDQAVGVGRARL